MLILEYVQTGYPFNVQSSWRSIGGLSHVGLITRLASVKII
jgi:hypothetical protein